MYFGALSLGELCLGVLCLGVHWQIRSAKAIQEFVYSRLAVGPIESLGSPSIYVSGCGRPRLLHFNHPVASYRSLE